MQEIPTLETERLILRGLRPDDLENFQALWSLPEVTRFTTGRKLDLEEAWERVLRHRGMWAVLGFGFWLIEDKATGRMAGEAGVQERWRDIDPPIQGTLEAGWVLAPEFHGKGLAMEAMQAVIGWTAGALPGKALTCLIDPANDSSLRLAGRLGFREIARTTYHGKPTIILRRRP